MNVRRAGVLVIGVCALVSVRAVHADIVLETGDLQLVIGSNGLLKHLTSKATGEEYLSTGEPCPMAIVYRGGQPSSDHQAILADTRNWRAFVEDQSPEYHGGEACPATEATMSGNELAVRFGKIGVVAVYRVTATPTYLAFQLVSVTGAAVDRLDLLHLRVKKLPNLGPWIDVAYDGRFGVCLCAGNVETNAGMNIRDRYVDMQAIAEREVALAGTTAVLFGFDGQPGDDFLDPKSTFLDRMEIVERDFRMPSGANRRRLPIQKESYLLCCDASPENIDWYIDCAKQMGFGILEIQWTAFSTGPGHFELLPRYRNGLADVKAMTDKIRAAGLHAGLHLHYNKAVKADAYVTPEADPRLHVVRAFTLAEPIDEQIQTISVRENPQGCTLDNQRRILRIGKELVAYERFTTEPPFQFQGCQRGHLKTRAASHAAGGAVGLLDVDSWPLFIRYDQTTDIQDDTARRIAEIYEQTGPYDFVYFDGAEDVHAPYWYNVSKAQDRVYRLWKQEPPACESACNMHYGWHMSTRGHAYDAVGPDLVKAFAHRMPSRTAPVVARSFTRINFGWLYPLSRMTPDILEYVESRAAAWDCPIAMVAIAKSDLELSQDSRRDDCLAVLKNWEGARCSGRLSGQQRKRLRTLDPALHRYLSCRLQEKELGFFESDLTEDQRRQLRNLDQEYHLLVNEAGEYEIVPIDEIAGVAGGKVKAYRFYRSSSPDDTWILAWAVKGSMDVRLAVKPERIAAKSLSGERLPVRAAGEETIVRIEGRTYLQLAGMKADQADHLLQTSVDGQKHNVQSAEDPLDRFQPEQPAGRDYEYTLTGKAPNPARHPGLGYLGGDPFVTHRLDAKADTWISGGFRVPPGAKEFRGVALKISRDGRPGPVEVCFGSAPGQDDLGAAKLDADSILPLYDVWQEAQIAPRTVETDQAIYWQLRTTAGADPGDHYVVYGPKPAGDGDLPGRFALAYRVLTDRSCDRIEVPGKQYTFQHVKELLGPYYTKDPRLELRGRPPRSGETTIDGSWTIHYAPDPEGVTAAAARDLAQFLSFRAGVTVPILEALVGGKPRTIELAMCNEAGFRKLVNTEEGYRVEVKPDRVVVSAQHSRGVMRGVYWIEEMMRFRGRACLQQVVVNRNCRFRRRMTASISLAEMTYDATSYPLVYTDGLLQKISHQGFNAIWLELNVEEVTARSQVFPELDDPEAERRLARLRDLVDRARPLGIDVIPYFSTNYHRPVPESFYAKHPDCRGLGWGNAMCTSHPDVRRYLDETVRNLFRAVPGLKGLVLIFESEGFWHCALGQQKNCPRCRDRKPEEIVVELLTTISTAMKGAAPNAELIAWSYGGATAPPWAGKVIARLPAGTIFQTEFSKGTRVARDGITNITEDYNITTVGPPENFRRQYDVARKTGLRVMAKTEHAISQEFITVPYIPCMRQWHDRAAKMAQFGLDGYLANWCHYGYMPSRPAELLMWYSWTGAPRLDDLLDQMARRDFGPQAARHVTDAWEHFTRGIRLFPYSDPIARYPGPLQKGPSQPLFLDPKIAGGGGRSWQNDLRWTRPWGPAVARKYLQAVADEFASGIDDLSAARTATDAAGQAALDGELGIVRILWHSLRSMVNLIRWIPVRDAYVAAPSEAERQSLRKQLVEIAREELDNAQAALAVAEADSRLGASSEAVGCRRGGLFTPALIRVKINMTEDLLRRQLTPSGIAEGAGLRHSERSEESGWDVAWEEILRCAQDDCMRTQAPLRHRFNSPVLQQ